MILAQPDATEIPEFREVDPYGDNLSVLVTCETVPAHHWMSFLCWYSLNRSLPDAKVVVACVRGAATAGVPWVFRLGVPFFFYKNGVDPVVVARSRGLIRGRAVVTPCHVLALRPLDETHLLAVNSSETLAAESVCFQAKDRETAVFCSYAAGVGRFVPAARLNNGGHPLGLADRLDRGDLTVNERKIFSLWRKSAVLFDLIG